MLQKERQQLERFALQVDWLIVTRKKSSRRIEGEIAKAPNHGDNADTLKKP
jgi:hypothetical protein